jgi:phenylacetate-CoA ligase
MKLIKQRYNKRFFDLVKVIDKRETYDADKMKTIQMKMLSRVINHAYNHVLYYHDFMDSNGIKPSDIKTVDDIKSFQ